MTQGADVTDDKFDLLVDADPLALRDLARQLTQRVELLEKMLYLWWYDPDNPPAGVAPLVEEITARILA